MTIETLELELADEEVADGLSGVLGFRLAMFLGEYVEAHNLGWVFNSDTDFILPGIGKRRPAAAFCSFDTLPEPERAAVPFPPDLAIEVTSSRDEIDNTDKKVNEYQEAKVKLIWVVRPIKQVVEVYRADGTAAIVTADGMLSGEAVIPGFELPLSKLFTLPTKKKA